MIQRYTRAHLTYAEDKLPAIKGIGDCLGDIMGDVYLDGFFAKTLPKSLCWYLEDDGDDRVEQTRRAPAWSWLA